LLGNMELSAHFINSNSAIHCCLIDGNKNVKQLATALGNQGIDVRPIIYPTVPEGKERLRICLHSFNNKQEISTVLEALKEGIIKSPAKEKRD
ncbi:MAG: hypothetical protein KJN76_02180, partial [Eudoraea sp.]|nr:hypothetical protein [Eudoraea sp.]